MPETINERRVFSLFEVTMSIQKTIAERYGSSFWVKAEMNKLNHYSHSWSLLSGAGGENQRKSDRPNESKFMEKRFRSN